METFIPRTSSVSPANFKLPHYPLQEAPRFKGTFKGTGDFIHFSGAKLMTDQMIRFNTAVTPESSVLLSDALVQLGDMKKQVGGSVKLLISNSPGGSVYHGFHIMDTMANLSVPVDTLILGGQTASMGALIFISGSKGRRFMSQNASLLIHRPSASGIGGTQNQISETVKEIERMRRRIDNLISARSNIPVQTVEKMTDKDTIIYPLKSLKLGLTDWVLVGDTNKALSQKSIAHLSDAEIEKRDTTGQYSDLPRFPFDAMLSSLPSKRGTSQQAILRAVPAQGKKTVASNSYIPGGDADDQPSFKDRNPSFSLPFFAPWVNKPVKPTEESKIQAEKPPAFNIYPYPRAFSIYA